MLYRGNPRRQQTSVKSWVSSWTPHKHLPQTQGVQGRCFWQITWHQPPGTISFSSVVSSITKSCQRFLWLKVKFLRDKCKFLRLHFSKLPKFRREWRINSMWPSDMKQDRVLEPILASMSGSQCSSRPLSALLWGPHIQGGHDRWACSSRKGIGSRHLKTTGSTHTVVCAGCILETYPGRAGENWKYVHLIGNEAQGREQDMISVVG